MTQIDAEMIAVSVARDLKMLAGAPADKLATILDMLADGQDDLACAIQKGQRFAERAQVRELAL